MMLTRWNGDRRAAVAVRALQLHITLYRANPYTKHGKSTIFGPYHAMSPAVAACRRSGGRSREFSMAGSLIRQLVHPGKRNGLPDARGYVHTLIPKVFHRDIHRLIHFVQLTKRQVVHRCVESAEKLTYSVSRETLGDTSPSVVDFRVCPASYQHCLSDSPRIAG